MRTYQWDEITLEIADVTDWTPEQRALDAEDWHHRPEHDVAGVRVFRSIFGHLSLETEAPDEETAHKIFAEAFPHHFRSTQS